MTECTILGHGPTRIECQYDHGQIFGVNNVYEFAPRLDKLFIVDRITEREFEYQKLARVKCLVTSVDYPEERARYGWKIELYPIDEVLAKFKTEFFGNAICYMMAYALLKGYERIYWYGIDMMTNSTYLFEKGSCEYWLGIAHAMGVPVINTRNSATGKTVDGKMYGYWGDRLQGRGNTSESYSRAVAEETARFVRQAQAGLSGADKFDFDPDGHLARKFEYMRAAQRHDPHATT